MTLALVISVTLIMGVIFVNGWTDAPNAIATAVSTRCIKPRNAVIMAVIFNFLGVFVMTLVNSTVVATISNMVSFGDSAGNEPLIALTAALFAIVVWAVVAWYFGIPTSESHALIAGLTGSAIAMGGFSAVNMGEWQKVLIGLGVSTLLGFGGGFLIIKLIVRLFKNVRRAKADRFFKHGENIAAGAMAFMHGAQDGQKFIGVFLLVLSMNGLVTRSANGSFEIPIYVMLLCSLVMGLGTSAGGYRIIKAVGMDMVNLKKHEGFASDLGATVCLLVSSLTGLPVSTTHTKTTAIMGVGSATRLSKVDWKVASDMVIAWILTFPGCGLIGFIMTKLFIAIF